VLKGTLIHPEILANLGAMGHGSQVLISDGNFPHDTAPYQGAARVYLNLSPGVLTVSQVLDAVATAIPIERVALMDPEDDTDPRPAAHAQLLEALPENAAVVHIRRFAFYAATGATDVGLVIATGDLRPYANVLITIGVVPAA
jgi:L-fucose mutarotase